MLGAESMLCHGQSISVGGDDDDAHHENMMVMMIKIKIKTVYVDVSSPECRAKS
jgi:hypothetical protein